VIRESSIEPSMDWRQELRSAFTDIAELLAFLDVPPESLRHSAAISKGFPLLVPRGFASQMRRGDPADPLLLQVLPVAEEQRQVPGFVRDPLRESELSFNAGLLHKYAGRALLMSSPGCAVHCRYCFRRHFPYHQVPRRGAWEPALAELDAATDIHELILSGGDPLMLDDADLGLLFVRLGSIEHLHRIRIHTRLPVVLPSRVTAALCSLLATHPRRCVLVVHANHAAELTAPQRDACRSLGEAGITLLNQSVLLRGVNDSAPALIALSERLFDCGVLPYYLHQLDPVAGTAHFAVDDQEARRLTDALRTRLPGYLVPRLVRESPGSAYKVPLL
jgi:EF-P beta-lysylation protein EpmB